MIQELIVWAVQQILHPILWKSKELVRQHHKWLCKYLVRHFNYPEPTKKSQRKF